MKGIIRIVILLLIPLSPIAESNAMQNLNPPIPEDLANFTDSFFQTHMKESHIPGAAIAIVKDGQIAYMQGYGLADIERQIPVTPQTIFRAGSVSKLFTATAIMQLVEQGQVDLHTDINEYLTRFQLEDNFDQPVTPHHLLTHTAGFDEHFIEMHERNWEDLPSLGDYLVERMPPRTLPPGEFISYNDHGYTLAGFIIEEVTGILFEDYIEHKILQPLETKNSTFQQPASDDILTKLATGYGYAKGGYSPYPLDYNNVAPAATLLTSAEDMAAFMIAHLNHGDYHGTQVLSPETITIMHSQQFTHHPLLRGRAYGFSEWIENGQRALFHDGGNPGFQNRLFLLPEHNLGFFLTFNIDQQVPGGRIHRQFTSKFLDYYFPEKSQGTKELSTTEIVNPRRYTGYYRDLQGYSHFTLEKLISLTNQFAVKSEDQALFVFGNQLRPVEPNVFLQEDGTSYVVFRQNKAGEITHLHVGTGAYEKLRWYESQPFHYALMGIFLLLFLSAGITSIFARSAFALPAIGSWGQITLGLVSGLNFVFLLGFGLAMNLIDRWEFTYGLPPVVVGLLLLPLMTTLLTVGLVLFSVMGWTSGIWPLWAKLYYSLVTMAALGFIGFLNYWNLLGFKF